MLRQKPLHIKTNNILSSHMPYDRLFFNCLHCNYPKHTQTDKIEWLSCDRVTAEKM